MFCTVFIKAEALRKQAEIEKQQELLLQKQQQEALRQQQAEQEFRYQQHLQQQQQYLSQHQHQHMPHQHQQQAYYGNSGTHNWNAPHQQTQSYTANVSLKCSPFRFLCVY